MVLSSNYFSLFQLKPFQFVLNANFQFRNNCQNLEFVFFILLFLKYFSVSTFKSEISQNPKFVFLVFSFQWFFPISLLFFVDLHIFFRFNSLFNILLKLFRSAEFLTFRNSIFRFFAKIWSFQFSFGSCLRKSDFFNS